MFLKSVWFYQNEQNIESGIVVCFLQEQFPVQPLFEAECLQTSFFGGSLFSSRWDQWEKNINLHLPVVVLSDCVWKQNGTEIKK